MTLQLGTLLTVFILSVGFFALLFYKNIIRGRALEGHVLNENGISAESVVETGSSSKKFAVFAKRPGEFIYRTDTDGYAGIVSFLNDNPTIKQADNQRGTGQRLLSNNQRPTSENFALVKQASEAHDEYLHSLQITSQVVHYLLQQHIKGIPVAFSSLGLHQKGTAIQAVFGTVLTDETVPQKKLTLLDAENIVRTIIQNETSEIIGLAIKSKEEVYNGELTGLAASDHNHIAAHVFVTSQTTPLLINKEFVIDLVDGAVLYSDDHIIDVKSRKILNCARSGCPTVRDDVSKTAATGDAEVDRSFAILGDVYDYYFNTFGRDSINNGGMTMRATVHYPGSTNFECPNAAWTGAEMIACSGLVANDVWGHEFTHGVTQSSADLCYHDQCGALNESISDIFGFAIDPDDWTMGEDVTAPGIPKPIRSMSNPPLREDPDKLFSSLYYTGRDQRITVHSNSGVLNKGFYLMTAGGSFNGCTIRGITKEKSLAVIYQALTKPGYLVTSSNFKDAYTVITQACVDLASAGGSIIADDCEQVKRALQAVEMDQQDGTQYKPKKAEVPATCRGLTPEPTTLPVTIVPTQTPTTLPTGGLMASPTTSLGASPTPEPTIQPTAVASTPIPTQSGPTPIPTVEPTNEPTATPTPRPESLAITIKLRFQGISSVPVTRRVMPVSVGLTGPALDEALYEKPIFTASDRGVWTGEVVFDVAPGDYCLLIKGPYHIQRKICHRNPTESFPGGYRTHNETISFTGGQDSLDFSHITQLAGDIGEQNGVVNAQDISICREKLNRSDSQSVLAADIDLDGVVTAQDCANIFEALAFKFDEE